MSNLFLTSTITTDNGVAYAVGDCIGGVVSLSAASALYGNNSLKLKSVRITDTSKQNAVIHVILFKTNPDLGTYTNNAAANVVTGDLQNIVAQAIVSAYSQFSATSSGFAELDVPIELLTTNLYMLLVTQTAVTYTSTTALQVQLGFGE